MSCERTGDIVPPRCDVCADSGRVPHMVEMGLGVEVDERDDTVACIEGCVDARDNPPDPAALMARLFPRRRARLTVEVDLDPVAGWGDHPKDWQRMIQRHLDDVAGHYHPTVVVEPPRNVPALDGTP